ncbi:MAG: hypothetical protein A2277_04710 [Desulfobacterales bacterium RIFOXYA12_FULL_46_15]|nr:MAG: hypothetical protein A2097_08415 [Desulfobacula sp. GWF2_41_7]OGR25310.1 MAG: hypothetical protein A2277_04710 [Desulfobacterales bacterium RIFOXYA12_FULL_46_15]
MVFEFLITPEKGTTWNLSADILKGKFPVDELVEHSIHIVGPEIPNCERAAAPNSFLQVSTLPNEVSIFCFRAAAGGNRCKGLDAEPQPGGGG